MPSGPFAHVCLLVKDLDQAIEGWTKLLEILDPRSSSSGSCATTPSRAARIRCAGRRSSTPAVPRSS